MSSESKSTYLFEQAPIPRAVAALVVPTLITQLINIIYNFADTWYLGRTNNPAAVAALSLSLPIYILIAALANLFGIGGASMISRSLGQKKTDKARHVFAFSLYGGLSAAVLYALMNAIFYNPLIYLIGGTDETYTYIRIYMFWTMIVGAIPTMGNMLCGHLVRSIGASREAGIGMSIGGILNIILDPLFMFVILPPGNEVAGAAIATCLSNTCATMYFIVFLYRRRENPVLTIHPRDISFTDHIPQDVLAIGLPAALQTSLAMISNIFVNTLVKSGGSAAVAGMGIAKKINTLAFNTTMGLTQGVLPLIAYSYGAKNLKRLKDTVRFTAAVGLIFTICCMVLFRVFSGSFVAFFITEEASLQYGQMFLHVIAFAAPLACLSYLSNTVFQATGRKGQSLLLSVLRKGLLDIPAMFVFKHFLGIIGVAWATPFAEVLSALLAAVLFIRLMGDLKKELRNG